MNVVTGAVGSIFSKLLQLLHGEYRLQSGWKNQVNTLLVELRHNEDFLDRVSEVPWNEVNMQAQESASDIREASYDMEDIIDTFLVQVEGHESADRSWLERAVPVTKLTELFCSFEQIMTRLQEVADRRARYRVDDLLVKSNTMMFSPDPRLKAMYNEVANLVGIEEPSKVLIAKLTARQGDDMAHRKKIFSIFGTGGLGKTTLAKLVYDKLRPEFKCAAFVSVGRNPNILKVLMDILYELDKKRFADVHTKKIDVRQVTDDIREFLKRKRYFIVIDDIWETGSWGTIKLSFLENNHGSRIIITTRNSEVATQIGDEVYRMQPLSSSNSKKLFYTRIFGAKEKWPDNELDGTSSKILKKCDGVPLAIITMASLLADKPIEKWSDVFTSVGFGHKDDQEVDNTMKILSFSYYDMPACLRTCLLYLSIYPEDYEINKESLIWKWIAEDFIQKKQGICLFELGEQYFYDLINRSMIQPVESKKEHIVEGCRVHDMILDLIRSISSQENFVTVLDNDEVTVSPRPRTVRRIAFHKCTMEQTALKNTVDMQNVRSFTAIGSTFGNQVQISNYKFLRVLDMVACKTVRATHLVHLDKLRHLRHLGLKDCSEIDDLPSEIGNLKLLKILNVENTEISQFPPSISQLTQLMCLKGDLEGTWTADWIGKLTSLEELEIGTDSENEKGFVKELGSLRELRVFRSLMHDKVDDSVQVQRDLLSSLCNLHKLQHLELWFENPDDTTVWKEEDFVLPDTLRTLFLRCIYFSSLPSCIGNAHLSHLTHLSIDVADMNQQNLEFLGKLAKLCYLQVYTESTVTISDINDSSSYFKNLRICRMRASMVQFRCKEGDSGVSFHIWNGVDAMPFGSSRNNCSLKPYAVMPKLEVLKCHIFVRALKDGEGDCGNIGLEYLPSLQKVKMNIDCKNASATEVDEVEEALWQATEVHPNRPTLEVDKYNEHEMKKGGRRRKR